MAMRWFNKADKTEVWDEAIEWPLGDIEAAHKIREICRAAADSAEKIAGAADRSRPNITGEVERYERAAKVAKLFEDELDAVTQRDDRQRRDPERACGARAREESQPGAGR